MNLRSIESVEKKLNVMIRMYGKENIRIDHGVGVYVYDSYEIKHEILDEDAITIYVKDFNNNDKVIPYMSFSSSMLKKMTDEEYDSWCHHSTIGKVSCTWNKEFPTILDIREY